MAGGRAVGRLVRAAPLLLIGCGGGHGSGEVATAPADAPSAATDSGGAPEPTSGTTLSVACTPTSNALRYSCTANVDPPQQVSFSWGADRADGGGIAATHTVAVRFVRPQTEVTVVATAGGTEARATFRTGEVPAGARIAYSLEGTPTMGRLLHGTPCKDEAVVVVSETDGAVVWYEELGMGAGAEVLGVSITEDDTVLAAVGFLEPPYDAVIEVDWDGNVLFYAEYGVHYANHVHHDAFKRNGHIFALFRDPRLIGATEYKGDGFYVFDETAQVVAEWKLLDHFTPPALPPGPAPLSLDYSHTNAITVSEDLEVTLSMRHLSAVAGVAGDWTQPDFGTIRWRISGDPANPDFGSDYALTSSIGVSPTFKEQHHAQRVGDRLLMLDNRLTEESRVIGVALDDASGIADVDEAYAFAVHCHYQGGAYATAAGNRTGTCAPHGRMLEWTPGAPEARFSLTADCVGGPDTDVPRFVPMGGGAAGGARRAGPQSPLVREGVAPADRAQR